MGQLKLRCVLATRYSGSRQRKKQLKVAALIDCNFSLACE
jgi:hypothetical protein